MIQKQVTPSNTTQ